MPYKICGTVEKAGTFLSRTVLLFNETTLLMQASMSSDPVTGAFQFLVLDNTTLYTVIVLPNDDELTVNAKVLAHLTPIAV